MIVSYFFRRSREMTRLYAQNYLWGINILFWRHVVGLSSFEITQLFCRLELLKYIHFWSPVTMCCRKLFLFCGLRIISHVANCLWISLSFNWCGTLSYRPSVCQHLTLRKNLRDIFSKLRPDPYHIRFCNNFQNFSLKFLFQPKIMISVNLLLSSLSYIYLVKCS